MPENNLNPVTSNISELKMQYSMRTCNGVKAVIEALLFASERPLTLERIKGVLDNLETNEIRSLLEELKHEYEQSNRGIRLTEIAGGFQIITAALFLPFLKKLYKQRVNDKLSRPALETLAIIAYKQPVTKLELEALRDVDVDGVMRGLLERNLIRICGRKKAPGRPKVYGTTSRFLEYFGLKALEDLPKIENFKEQKLKEALDVIKEPAP